MSVIRVLEEPEDKSRILVTNLHRIQRKPFCKCKAPMIDQDDVLYEPIDAGEIKGVIVSHAKCVKCKRYRERVFPSR